MSILVTGGCGFIGSNFILEWFSESDEKLINLDKLSYAASKENLNSISNKKNFISIEGDIGDSEIVDHLLNKYRPNTIINFAAETHVDRSIENPISFFDNNIMCTIKLLEGVKKHFQNKPDLEKTSFKFIQVSTDEVYGSLDISENAFTEGSKYQPNSPYSASKASSDHIVRSYFQTYNIPTIITNCSNNYGPYQYPEKLIPLVINNILNEKKIPVYGSGENIRDWLYVKDHCRALIMIIKNGRLGETYNIGGNEEHRNIDVIKKVCNTLAEIKSLPKDTFHNLISHVDDRPGHDFRYAIDSRKLKKEIGWEPKNSFDTGLYKTVDWYLNNSEWLEKAANSDYQNWVKNHYK